MEKSFGELDRLDRQLLDELARNGRATHQALGDAIGRSPSAIARRQKLLEESGVIAGYQARLDMSRLGLGTLVHIKVALTSQSKAMMEDFERAIGECPSVVRCDLMSGSDDYIITVIARSLDDFADVHRQELAQLPGVARMESGFVLREIVATRLPPGLILRRP